MDEIRPDLVDELLKGYEKPEDIIGENGLLKRLTKALLERAMNAELTVMDPKIRTDFFLFLDGGRH